jgi:hypothetical protein
MSPLDTEFPTRHTKIVNNGDQTLGTTEISAALAVGIIALLITGLQPILLGELVAHKLISLEGVGLVAMGEIVALGVGVIVGDVALPITRIRAVTAIAATAVALLDFSAISLRGDLPFALNRAACGLAEGVLVWVTTCTIVRCPKPERIAGIFLTLQTLAQALVAALCALVVIPLAGWKGGFVTLGVLGLLILAIVPALHDRFEPLSKTGSNRPPMTPATILTLMIVFLQMSAIGSLWPYLDPLGRSFGFGPRFLEMLVALVLGFQVLGGAIATVAVGRMRTAASLLIVGSVQVSVALALFSAPALSPIKFASLWSVFGLLWLFAMPFHVRLALLVDSTGRVAMLVPAFQLLGTAFGPLVTSLIVTDSRPRLIPLICAGFSTTAAMLLVLLLRRSINGSDLVVAHSEQMQITIGSGE